MKSRLRVGVLFGGQSGEHEVSLASARSVLAEMDTQKYEPIPIGITKEGRWLLGDASQALLGDTTLAGDTSSHDDAHGVAARDLVTVDEGTFPSANPRPSPLASLDVVFPVLHGPYGEDGTVQGLLELADIPYVGAGVLASAVSMDKVVMKDVFIAHHLPVVRHLAFLRRDWDSEPGKIMEQAESTVGYPCFVKPANLGSSVGISKATDRDSLYISIQDAVRYDRKVLVESAVRHAREIECSVLGNDDPIASVLGEIIPSREFYDYEAKYLDETSELLIPAPVPDDVADSTRELAIEVFKAVDCAGMARVDFLLDGVNGDIYVNELNTIPGFTTISMYAKLWEASGISYTTLIDRLIALAIERHQDMGRSAKCYLGKALESDREER